MKSVATLGPIGFLPAPGTISTLCTIFFIYIISPITNFTYIFICTLLFLFAFFVISSTLKKCESDDPSEIIFDEVVGTFVTFFNVTVSFKFFLIGFLLFRFFDMTKVCGIKKIEKLHGAWGVLCDDIAAGLLSNILLHVIMYYS